jgi:benzylsuccinate CoA-transferase BbsE subunit
MSPVNNPADLVASPQLAARGFFVPVEHPPTGRTLTMPGAPARLTASPASVRLPAPALGQHNLNLLGELGLTPGDAAHLAAAGVI